MKQEISILINGKKKRYSESKFNNEQEHSSNEIAAAIEVLNKDKYMVLAEPLKKNEIAFKRKKMNLFSKKRTGFYLPQKGKSLPKQILAAVMAAVVTGTVLGIMVLMVFSTDITEAGNFKPETAPVQKEEAPSGKKLVSLPPINLEFSALQAGVFSTKERAEDVVKSIEDKGFSAVIISAGDEKSAVIVGIANEKHQLESYGESYQKKMEKPLVKTLSFSFDNLKTPSNLDETYFTNGQILLQNVLTLSQMPGTKESGLDQTLSDFNKWKQYGQKQKKNWKVETANAASDFEKQLEGAFLALKDTKKGELNWAFQQKAMDSLQSYKQLLQTLK
ncbi:SPOR domain-containing protein [Fictibacillus halophilus]|uniref:SPOR domain-containing protein n=1 Tax=Fictibacillus halophilus TaxID=1610490 RepID=UPI00363879B5